MTSQRDDSAHSHDVEDQSDRKDGALDIATHDGKSLPNPNIVDWDGPDDPENPLNWASSKKLATIAIVSCVTMLS